jgi:hypothetical protein
MSHALLAGSQEEILSCNCQQMHCTVWIHLQAIQSKQTYYHPSLQENPTKTKSSASTYTIISLVICTGHRNQGIKKITVQNRIPQKQSHYLHIILQKQFHNS